MGRQKGAALIVVLSLLTVSLMLGLSSMQSSQIDERLAGNYRAATEAQMHAEEVASALYALIGLPSDGKSRWDEFDEDDLPSDFGWSEFFDIADHQDNDDHCHVLDGGNGAACYVLVDSDHLDVDSGDYIIAMGFVDGVLAQSEPLYLQLSPSEFDFSSLSPFGVVSPLSSINFSNAGGGFDGKGEVPDVRLASQSDLDTALAESPELINDWSEYDFSSSPVFSEDGAGLFHDFIFSLIAQAGGGGGCGSGTYYCSEAGGGSGNNKDGFGNNFSFDDGDGGAAVSYVKGDITSNNISGKGVLVVDGDFKSNGNPSFDGFIIVLGRYVPGSGGGGDDVSGALLVAPYDVDEKNDSQACSGGCEFVDADVAFGTGGGGMGFVYDEQSLKSAYEIMNESARKAWNVGGGGGGVASNKPVISLWE